MNQVAIDIPVDDEEEEKNGTDIEPKIENRETVEEENAAPVEESVPQIEELTSNEITIMLERDNDLQDKSEEAHKTLEQKNREDEEMNGTIARL